MALVAITEAEYDVEIRLAYATPDNLTGKPVYARPLCYLHRDAAAALRRAVAFARKLDLQLRIFDAFRPTEAQWRLWNHNPDPVFLADPRRGSPHSRGVAVDLTLLDRRARRSTWAPRSTISPTAPITTTTRSRQWCNAIASSCSA